MENFNELYTPKIQEVDDATTTDIKSLDDVYGDLERTNLQNTLQGGRVRTNIDYFDEKPKLSLFDQYVANRLGVSLSNNLNLNQRLISGTKSNDDIFQTLSGIEITENHAKGIENNSGIWKGFARWLNDRSGGITPLDNDNAKFKTTENQVVYSTARSLGNGKTTNEQTRDAKNTYASRLKSAQQNYASVAEALNQQAIFLEKQIQNHINKGYSLPKSVLDRLERTKTRVEALREAGETGKLDPKKWDYESYVIERGKDGDSEIIRYKATLPKS